MSTRTGADARPTILDVGRYFGFIGREPDGDFQMIAASPNDPRWVSDNLRDWVETHPLSPGQAATVMQLVEVIASNMRRKEGDRWI